MYFVFFIYLKSVHNVLMPFDSQCLHFVWWLATIHDVQILLLIKLNPIDHKIHREMELYKLPIVTPNSSINHIYTARSSSDNRHHSFASRTQFKVIILSCFDVAMLQGSSAGCFQVRGILPFWEMSIELWVYLHHVVWLCSPIRGGALEGNWLLGIRLNLLWMTAVETKTMHPS